MVEKSFLILVGAGVAMAEVHVVTQKVAALYTGVVSLIKVPPGLGG